MALFQPSVLKKYLKLQDEAIIEKAFKKFSKYFHNTEIQSNIRDSKEEQFQAKFLDELFVNVFGYTLFPQPKFDLSTEFKNLKGAKKADGAILKDGKAIAVIELKGTKTKDLESIRQQAFDYKANQPDCVYVITSNFEKLRFYVNNAVEFEEFDLFNLTLERFQLLYLCLSQSNVFSGIPLKVKEASIAEEEAITKKFYADYSLFKRELFRDLVKKNMRNPVFRNVLAALETERADKNIKLRLFKKSQKLIDRFLFIFFAEDRGLLPPNSTVKIIAQWNKLKELDEIVPLYDRYKKYFGYLDLGRKGTDKSAEIFAYNGGLFKPDEVLDSLVIDDELLAKHTAKLANYDFDSQVDVNILGHIFENSLNEIESVNAEIEGTEFDKQKTKRKKDGVFYTPKYITKYIVDNTVGKLCDEKKQEIGIEEEEYFKNRKGRKKKKLTELSDKIETYRNWLLQITICDPACGSGAFLNQALDFLIKEHEYLDELQTRLLGGGFVFPDIENTVLENNIYGVDLNEESVEIAKLSLWLRTAQPRRKLNDLSSNIKCGNSLINSKSVAGDKAFNWEDEFKHVFEKGGFDVVIGNPPYVLCQPSNTPEDILSFYKKYQVASYKIDLFHLFFEKSIGILCNGGVLGFITPNTYLNNKYIRPLRHYILVNTVIEEVINHEEAVFSEASVDVATIILRNKELNPDYLIRAISSNSVGEFNLISLKKQTAWINDPDNLFNLKVDFPVSFDNCINLEKICNSYFGIQAYDRKSSINEFKINDDYVPLIDGSDINRYEYSIAKKYFNFLPANIKSGGDINVYSKNRIVVRQIGKTPVVGLCKQGIYTSNTMYNLYINDENYCLKFILAILNSKLIKKYWEYKYSDGKQLFPKIKGYQLRELPIHKASKLKQLEISKVVDEMLERSFKSMNLDSNFKGYLVSTLNVNKLSKKLQNWHELDFAEFIKEINKAIKATNKERLKNEQEPIPTLTKLDEMDWMEVFETKKAEAQALKAEIDKTDKEIDQMVYELYGLTEAEIEIVENS